MNNTYESIRKELERIESCISVKETIGNGNDPAIGELSYSIILHVKDFTIGWVLEKEALYLFFADADTPTVDNQTTLKLPLSQIKDIRAIYADDRGICITLCTTTISVLSIDSETRIRL